MFINIKTGKPVRLLAQTQDGDVIYAPGGIGHKITEHTVLGHDFFVAHREATPEEIEEHTAVPPAPPALIGHANIDLKKALTAAEKRAEAAEAKAAEATSANAALDKRVKALEKPASA